MSSTTKNLRVGLCGIGLDAYWPQFAGLEERLKGYVAQMAARLARPGVEVVNLGLVDTPQRSARGRHHAAAKILTCCFSMLLLMRFRIRFCHWFSAPECRWWC